MYLMTSARSDTTGLPAKSFCVEESMPSASAGLSNAQGLYQFVLFFTEVGHVVMPALFGPGLPPPTKGLPIRLALELPTKSAPPSPIDRKSTRLNSSHLVIS